MDTSDFNKDATENRSKFPTNEEAEKAYKYLFDLSTLQNNLLWTRTNVLLIIQGSILTLITSNLIGNNSFGKILLSLFGLLMAFFLLRITKGGSFWITHFESKMKQIEKYVKANKKFETKKNAGLHYIHI